MLNKITAWKRSKEKETPVLVFDETRLPQHIAIIMDGNGRWAKKRGLPRVAGHHEGMKVVRKIVKKANEIGIKTLTLYAFSTENWKRPKAEVEFLMRLPEQFLTTYLPELIDEKVKVTIMGRKDDLPVHTIKAINEAMNRTAENDGLTLNFALNYGGRAEITHAVKQVADQVKMGKIMVDQIDEQFISSHLMSSGLTEPDLLIRTSGEIRLSNFMLWQLAYTEFWFTDVLWPDFSEKQLLEAIEEYQKRKRRYGGV